MSTAMAPEISFGDRFFASVTKLSPADGQRVIKAVDRFRENPQHPSLRLKPLNGDTSGRLHSIRAADDVRVLLWREGPVFVMLEAGPRQSIYERVDRGRFTHNPGTGFIGIIESPDRADVTDRQPVERLTKPPIDERPGVFDHWGDSDLRKAGFSDACTAALRSCKTEEELCDGRLELDEFENALEIMEVTPEQWRAPALIVDRDIGEQRLRDAIEHFGDAHGLSPFFTPDEVARIAAAPIEDWMIFLHPDQRAVVRRRFEGPARIRGAAGTGKTVVALHRAAELARRFDDLDGSETTKSILFTTFVKTLPPVFERLYSRLPNAVSSAVEFVHVDRLARRVVTQGGVRVNTAPRDINAAWAKAHRAVVRNGTPLAKADLTRNYLRTEITAVLKGRGVASLDEYLGLERTGRKVRFTEPMRTQAWELMNTWNEEMAARGTIDFSDVILLARDAARGRADPAFRSAIVDEAQDITLVGLQFIRALVTGSGSDPSDGLLLVGDGAQRIYAGGFTLRQAGIEVTGRSTILRSNYRNTAEILGAAMAIAGDQQVDDLEEEYRRDEAPAKSVRAGGIRPVLVECASEADETAFVLRRIRDLIDNGSMTHGDIGVFVPTNREVDRLVSALRSAGIPREDLAASGEASTDEVKVGTYFRAKGLEFKVVFLPGLDERFPRRRQPGQDAAEYEEDRALGISQLFVAMTRARDALFVLAPGSPSPVLVEHLDAFDVVES